MTEEITAELRAIREKLETISNVDASPRIKGDLAAARYAGYRTAKVFRAWARRNGLNPSFDGETNFWSRVDIAKARERGKR